jgi:hypothetical protein
MTMSTTYSTANSALILVDVLNDFLAEDGKLAGMIGPMIEKLELRRNLQPARWRQKSGPQDDLCPPWCR